MIRYLVCGALLCWGALVVTVGGDGHRQVFGVAAALALVGLSAHEVAKARRLPALACLGLLLGLGPAHAQAGHVGVGFFWQRSSPPAVMTTAGAVQLQAAPCVTCGTAALAVQAPVMPTVQSLAVYQPAASYYLAPAPAYAAPAYAAPPAAALSFAPVAAPPPAMPPAGAPIQLQAAPAAAAPDRYWLLRLDGGGTMTVQPVQPRQ